MDITTAGSYKIVGWRTDMWRGCSFYTFLVTLLAIQFLVPLTWVQQGLDCTRRCRLAATTGMHCPLMYNAQNTKSQHHCHEQESARSSLEVRCNCSPASPLSSTLDAPRFVLPQVVTFTASPFTRPHTVEPIISFVDIFLVPPDPPPRALALGVL